MWAGYTSVYVRYGLDVEWSLKVHSIGGTMEH